MTLHRFLQHLSASDVEVLETYRPLAHQRIVLTGKLADDLLRETASGWLYKWGAVIEDKVNPATDILLAVDPDRMTTKRKDAARYGIPVVNEDGFVAYLSEALERAQTEAGRLGAITAPPPPPKWFADPENPDDFEDTIAPLTDRRA
jgi:hypothetical protein